MIHFPKILITALLLFLGSYQILSGQRSRPFRTWVEMQDERSVKKGYLGNLGDTSVSIFSAPFWSDSEFLKIPVERIDLLKFRKSERPGKFFTIGVISGLIIGSGIAATIKEPTGCSSSTMRCTDPRAKYIFYGVTTGLGLGGVGAALGTLKIRVPIGGKPGNYLRQKEQMKRFLLNKKN